MSLFPCIRRGSDRWWLPCSEPATDAIGQLILSDRERAIDATTRLRVIGAIESDPPLMIYAALQCAASKWGARPWGDGHQHDRQGVDHREPAEILGQIETSELVDWLVENVTDHFANGDAFLGAPIITAATESRWRRLSDHFRTLPFERWLDDASLWLEACGPKVSAAWQQQWPSAVIPANDTPQISEPAGTSMLQQMARHRQQQLSLEHSFDHRLEKTKLDAIQQLAYGLSHEINNPLANISTRAQQLQRGENDDSRVATLQRIIDQVYRAHEMIADLMFYANPPQARLDPCDLSPLVRSVVESFAEEAQRQDIRVEVTMANPSTMVIADAEMIGEAIRVLVRNAIEAIGCQGTIVVSIDGDAEYTRIHVADSGPGLSDSARRHAFDPYYSGREAGRGLGLGLCRAYRVAQLHHAEIVLAGGPAGCVATIAIPTEL